MTNRQTPKGFLALMCGAALLIPFITVVIISGSRIRHEPWLLGATATMSLALLNFSWTNGFVFRGVKQPGDVAALGAKLYFAVFPFITGIAAIVLALKKVDIWQGIVTFVTLLLLGVAQTLPRMISETVTELNERIEAPSTHADWVVQIGHLASLSSLLDTATGEALRKLSDDSRYLARDIYGVEVSENALIDLSIKSMTASVEAKNWAEVAESIEKVRQIFAARELTLRHLRSGR